jgi:hypothetical protein
LKKTKQTIFHKKTQITKTQNQKKEE